MAILRMQNRDVDSSIRAGASSVYATWCEQIKAYIIARLLHPGHLTESEVESIVSFARSLSPVKEHIELIKSQHHPDDVGEFIHHLKILVKDSAKKLQTSNECQKAGRDLRGNVVDPPGKYYQYLFRMPLTDSRSQCLTRIGTPHFPCVL